MPHVSIASAGLKFGISGIRRKSRTYPSTARSHVFPSVPARIDAPQSVSHSREWRTRRNQNATSGTAASETATQIRDGNSPQATPRLVASWIQRRCGTTVVVEPGEQCENARDLAATSRQAPARASAAKRGHRRFTSLQRPDRAPRRA